MYIALKNDATVWLFNDTELGLTVKLSIEPVSSYLPTQNPLTSIDINAGWVIYLPLLQFPVDPLVIGVAHDVEVSVVLVVSNIISIEWASSVVPVTSTFHNWYLYFGIHTKYALIADSGIVSPTL